MTEYCANNQVKEKLASLALNRSAPLRPRRSAATPRQLRSLRKPSAKSRANAATVRCISAHTEQKRRLYGKINFSLTFCRIYGIIGVPTDG